MGGSAVLRCWLDVGGGAYGGGVVVARGSVAREHRVSGASSLRPWRSLRSLNRDPSSGRGNRLRAEKSLGAPALARRQQSLRSYVDKHLTSFGAGLAHAFITGCADP